MSVIQPSIAIIGSGPSGCYSAQFLRKKWPEAEITVFEALPAPYGLLRYGVATDHQGTKSVSAQFDRLFTRDRIQLAANICVGVDVSIEQITSNFDVVVRATGLNSDSYLGIDIDPECSIIGAGALLKAINGFPVVKLPTQIDGSLAPLGSSLALIGMGNVSMDVARILSKSNSEFHGSDVDDTRLSQLRQQGINSIDIFGRSSVEEAKFDLSMLKELLELESIKVQTTGLTDSSQGKAAELLRTKELDHSEKTTQQTTLTFHFGVIPQEIKSTNGKSSIIVKTSGTSINEFLVDTTITAVGFTNDGDNPAIENLWDKPNVFKVGWLNRNGKGTIAENRKDAKSVTTEIIKKVEMSELIISGRGYESIQDELIGKQVRFEDWERINDHECQNSPDSRCRRKITDIPTMISIAQQKTA